MKGSTGKKVPPSVILQGLRRQSMTTTGGEKPKMSAKNDKSFDYK